MNPPPSHPDARAVKPRPVLRGIGIVVRAALKLAFAAIICLGLASCFLWVFMLCEVFPIVPRPSPSELPDDRGDYMPYDLNAERFTRFNEQYAAARSAYEPWTEDPREVGLRFAGYPNVDGIQPDIVREFHPEPGRVIVVVLAMGAFDDSVEAKKIRVDLVREVDVWRVEWAGGQWRCQSGRGHWYWGAGLCS